MNQAYSTGILFQDWNSNWGLRGDPFMWDDMKSLIGKEPLPGSVLQFTALLERAFEQIAGVPISSLRESVYIQRYDQGGMSGGHVCIEFWRDRVIPELQKNYMSIRSKLQQEESVYLSNDFVSSRIQQQLQQQQKLQQPSVGQDQQLLMISKPCRFEFYPEGCRYGTSCRFRHSFPIKPAGKLSPTSVSSVHAPHNNPTQDNVLSLSSMNAMLNGNHSSNTGFGTIGSGFPANTSSVPSIATMNNPYNGLGNHTEVSAGHARLPENLRLNTASPGRSFQVPNNMTGNNNNADNLFCFPSTTGRAETNNVVGGNPRSSSVCIHFLRGKCTFGTACRFSHF